MSDMISAANPTAGLSAEVANDEKSKAEALPPLLKQYFYAALRWKWLVLGIIVAALIAGVLVTLLTPASYTASAQIEIAREQKNITKVEGLDSAEADRDPEFYETQYSLLRAQSLADRVVKVLNLTRRDDFFTAHGVTLDPTKYGANSKGVLSPDQLSERLKLASALTLANVDVSPVRRSRLVDVSYTSRSPAISAEIANAWTQQFIAANLDRRLASTVDARGFLEARLAELRAKLETSERDVVTYASKNDIITLDSVRDAATGKTQSQRTLAGGDLDALNGALNTATADRIAAESRAKMVRSGKASPEELTNSVVSVLRQKRAEVASDYARMLLQYEPDYPAARALKEQIDTLDGSLARETSRIAGSHVLTYEEALRRENDLRALVEVTKQRYDRQQNATIQYNIYQREADTNRQLYDALLQRYKEIGIAGSVGVNNIVIVDGAPVPERPSAPSLPRNLALALIAGLAVSVLVVVGLEQIDEGISNPGQISQMLSLPVLGYVPLTDKSTTELLADMQSAISEAYFSIRSNLAFTTSHGLPRSIMVTSTRPNEGKSTSAFALACTIGRTGKRVLLVDGDLRSPDVHHLTQVGNEAGLSNLLAGDNDIAGLIKETQFRGVYALTSGPQPPSAAELLSSDRIKALIGQLEDMFDHVVIDSPPILGLTDAPLLGRAVEGCVIVIQAKGPTIRGVRGSLARLKMVDTHIFGVILTKLPQRELNYGYGYGYGYGTGYEYGEGQSDEAPRSKRRST